jgi:hypothetical protein
MTVLGIDSDIKIYRSYDTISTYDTVNTVNLSVSNVINATVLIFTIKWS